MLLKVYFKRLLSLVLVNYQAPKFFNTLDCDIRDTASVSLFQIKQDACSGVHTDLLENEEIRAMVQ